MNATGRLFAPMLLLLSYGAIAQTVDRAVEQEKNSNALSPDSQPLSSVDLSSKELARIRAHGPWPGETPADAGNEFSGLGWAEKLGQQLFNEKRLSGKGDLSCASCHIAEYAFTDNAAVATGAQTHVRNTQGLLDIGLQRWFGWDGGADSLWAAALRPMLSEIEMAGDITFISEWLRQDSDLPSTLKTHASIDSSLLSDEALVVASAKIIAAYTRTLRSGQTPFDLFLKAASKDNTRAMSEYPAAAKRGLKLFLGEANCQACHFGPNFSNGEFHDTGRPFFTAVGQVDPGRYTGIQRVKTDPYNLLGAYNGKIQQQEQRKVRRVKLGQSNWGQWRTPSLRNLTLTAPYMHDGSIPTLRGVIDAYADIDPDRLHAKGESILKPLNLSDEQRNDMVEFLKTLSP